MPPNRVVHPPRAARAHIDRTVINRLFVVLVVLSNTFGNLLLAIGMEAMPDLVAVPFAAYIVKFLTEWHIMLGIALLAVWMVAQLTMLTWADLTYVLPVTASGYIFIALLGRFFLHERVSSGRWIGILLIAIGSSLASIPPIHTAPHPTTGELTE